MRRFAQFNALMKGMLAVSLSEMPEKWRDVTSLNA